MPPPNPIRVAVIGAGAFGRNHLRVYRELEATSGSAPAAIPVQLAAVVDPNPSTREEAAGRYSIPAFATIDELLAANLDIHAASICVPTIHHAAAAEPLLAAGLDVLIEKPFAATLEQADRVIALARQHHRIVQIGHLERFNPAVAATLARLNRPMFFEAHRLSLFTPRSLDVDVVLDLMIHDIDIVLAFAQSEVREVRATGIPILSRKTDIANVRVEFASGAVANFTASRVSTEQVRKLRLFQPHQYLSLDFARQELINISVDPAALAAAHRQAEEAAVLSPPNRAPHRADAFNPLNTPAEGAPAISLKTPPDGAEASSPLNPAPTQTGFSPGPQPPHVPQHPTPGLSLDTTPPEGAGAFRPLNTAPTQTGFSPGPQRPQAPQHPTPGLSLDKISAPRAEPLRLELEDFLHAIATRTAPRVTAQAGRAALALALQINAEIEAHAHRAGLR